MDGVEVLNYERKVKTSPSMPPALAPGRPPPSLEAARNRRGDFGHNEPSEEPSSRFKFEHTRRSSVTPQGRQSPTRNDGSHIPNFSATHALGTRGSGGGFGFPRRPPPAHSSWPVDPPRKGMPLNLSSTVKGMPLNLSSTVPASKMQLGKAPEARSRNRMTKIANRLNTLK